MAGQALKRLPPLWTSVAVLAACAVIGLAGGILGPIDAQIVSLWHTIRGERQADSSIVICYLDDAAIRSLGWPIPRNFHALMVRVLTELGADGIGLDVVFEDRKPEYPEYDELLTTMAGMSGMTVVPAYFDRTDVPETAWRDSSLLFEYPGVAGGAVKGSGLHLPYAGLSGAAAGIGHVNLGPDGEIPAVVETGQGMVPAFALELLRVSLDVPRRGFWYADGSVSLRSADGSLRFTIPDGIARMNHPGSLSAYRSFPFLEVLRAYDRARQDLASGIPLESFRGKTVLITVIAEGRSRFVQTPVNERTPSVLLHTAFIDNARGAGFLTPSPWWLVVLACMLAGAAGVFAVHVAPSPFFRFTPAAVVCAAGAVCFGLYAGLSIVLPAAPMMIAAMVAAIPALAARQGHTHRRMKTLEREREEILSRLRSREERVALLEHELADNIPAAPDRIKALTEELHKTREEIRTLTSRADDMTPFPASGEDATPLVEEFEGMVYTRNGPLSKIVELARRIAPNDAPVLILGESGTGKELIARAIHRLGKRSAGPFVAVNCGALSENLLESELFGHERGAFTGAVKERAGRFETADAGTIFLDEIGETSESFQVKLLRVLQEGEFERVGGSSTVRVNVRVLAATNRDVRAAVREGSFREDLYYRLNVLSVALPPLRERTDDILPLALRFVRREKDGVTLSTNVVEALRLHLWPGNIRELESTLRRAVLMAVSEGRTIVAMKDLPEEIASAARSAVPLELQILESVRRKGFSRRSISETADELGGLNRGTVAEYLRGEFLSAFCAHGYDPGATVCDLAGTQDPEVESRVRKRLLEYLENLTHGLTRGGPREPGSLRPKLKNLPQRYHFHAEQIAGAFCRKEWDFPA